MARGLSTVSGLNELVIASAARTGMGSFQKTLAPLSATQLGSVAVKVRTAAMAPVPVTLLLLRSDSWRQLNRHRGSGLRYKRSMLVQMNHKSQIVLLC